MNRAQLATMANQIGAFFASMPDHDEALAGIADHLRRFWEPRMRRALLTLLDDPHDDVSGADAPGADAPGADAPGADALAPLVRAALIAHRAQLTPAAATDA
ncbi:formate dehydrogenase subunit delta [Burkholderia sp. FERM BP-3421]|uniref:formate dehydrogenase subunit delta n=1 Tax=Burkholderia sp. FERM BP-3421 TaxID=1494466 RepID=UPI00235F8AEB|nr:formate dehydrogenase subunit delta [Burkholderia sp. FERM BP-3421]WDD93358.1 formate dehydrogenase subunit delta [Burkholderia sp. FERM BP-3421]